MDAVLFVKSVAVGLAIAAAIGPISLLCIQRTLTGGFAFGFVSGLGAACADGVYGAIAGLGLAAVSQVLVAHTFWLQLAGGMFMVWLGVQAARRPIGAAAGAASGGGLRAFGSVFLLTLANPMTILSFVAVFAGLGVVAAGTTASAPVVMAGVFLGSALWWLALAGGVALIRLRLSPRRLAAVNRVSGVMIAAFGLWAIVGALIA